jgi:hypothetical protein
LVRSGQKKRALVTFASILIWGSHRRLWTRRKNSNHFKSKSKYWCSPDACLRILRTLQIGSLLAPFTSERQALNKRMVALYAQVGALHRQSEITNLERFNSFEVRQYPRRHREARIVLQTPVPWKLHAKVRRHARNWFRRRVRCKCHLLTPPRTNESPTE